MDAPHILVNLSSDELNSVNPIDIPRAWWRSNAERTKYEGYSESLVLLRDILAKDRYEASWRAICRFALLTIWLLFDSFLMDALAFLDAALGCFRLQSGRRYGCFVVRCG